MVTIDSATLRQETLQIRIHNDQCTGPKFVRAIVLKGHSPEFRVLSTDRQIFVLYHGRWKAGGAKCWSVTCKELSESQRHRTGKRWRIDAVVTNTP